MFNQHNTKHIGRAPNKNKKPNFEKHWNYQIAKFSKTLTILKENAAIETIHNVGYTLLCGKIEAEKISKIYSVAEEVGIDSAFSDEDSVSSGDFSPCLKAKSFETIEETGHDSASS